MRQLKFELWKTYVLSVLEIPWDKADPRGPGGQYEFHCNEINGSASYVARHYTFWGPTDGPHAIEKLAEAERAFEETFAMIKDAGHPGVPGRSGDRCVTPVY